MSHLQGTDYVGSMVVFEDGLPKKSDYRHFKVATVAGNDDYAAMEEVLTRRLTALLDEERTGARRPPSGRGRRTPPPGPARRRPCRRRRFAYPPQLLLLDGGLGQLHVGVRVLDRLGLTERIPVASLAKSFEEVYLPGLARSRSACPASPRPSTCSSGSATRPTGSPSPTTAPCGASG